MAAECMYLQGHSATRLEACQCYDTQYHHGQDQMAKDVLRSPESGRAEQTTYGGETRQNVSSAWLAHLFTDWFHDSCPSLVYTNPAPSHLATRRQSTLPSFKPCSPPPGVYGTVRGCARGVGPIAFLHFELVCAHSNYQRSLTT
jgi:hypothetical protein